MKSSKNLIWIDKYQNKKKKQMHTSLVHGSDAPRRDMASIKAPLKFLGSSHQYCTDKLNCDRQLA